MKNILFIADYAAPYRGNFIPSLEAIESHLPDGSQVVYAFPKHVAQQSWMAEFQQEHIVVFIEPMFFSKHIQWQTLKRLKAICKRYRITTIHTHFVTGNINLFLLSRITKLRMVATLHNHYFMSGRLGQWRRYLFLKTNDFVIGVSASVAESARRIGVPENQLMAIPNAINFSRFETSQPVILRNANVQKVILMFGYPWHRKGVDVVVRAVHQLREDGTPIGLAIAQSGREEDTKEAIRNVLGELPDYITFLPPIANSADYYNAADIFISAGREEGLCYSPIEAAYCACDVICSRIGGNPLDIPHIGIYETENVQELKGLITAQLNEQPDIRQQRKQTQRDYVVAQYNMNNWAEQVLRTY